MAGLPPESSAALISAVRRDGRPLGVNPSSSWACVPRSRTPQPRIRRVTMPLMRSFIFARLLLRNVLLEHFAPPVRLGIWCHGTRPSGRAPATPAVWPARAPDSLRPAPHFLPSASSADHQIPSEDLSCLLPSCGLPSEPGSLRAGRACPRPARDRSYTPAFAFSTCAPSQGFPLSAHAVSHLLLRDCRQLPRPAKKAFTARGVSMETVLVPHQLSP
jgi:hypothetical protein